MAARIGRSAPFSVLEQQGREEFRPFERFSAPYLAAYGVAALFGLIAGSVRMPWLHFLPANIVGAQLWTLAWGVGPYPALHVVQPLARQWWG